MLVLSEIPEPHDEVEMVQPQVVAYWEKECLGQGDLFITSRIVTWISNRTRQGFRLPFPAISVHAISGSSDDFPEACLLLVIDISKTEIEYKPEVENVDDEDDEDIINTAAVRFAPSDPAAIQGLFEAMNSCQERNPDANDGSSNEDMNEEDEECNMGEQPYEGDEEPNEEDSQLWHRTENNETATGNGSGALQGSHGQSTEQSGHSSQIPDLNGSNPHDNSMDHD